jgi:hypothetical protein
VKRAIKQNKLTKVQNWFAFSCVSFSHKIKYFDKILYISCILW